MAKVRLADHKGQRSTFELNPGTRYTIGRAGQNELVLEDPSLSRHHAEIRELDGAWIINDCGSRNGTLVGGRRIEKPVRLEPGMQIVLGACSLTMEGASTAQPTGTVVFADKPMESGGTMVLSPEDVMQSPKAAARDPKGFEAELEKIRKRLEIVEKANLELLAHEKMDVMLGKILDLVFEAVRPERAALVQRRADGELVCRAFRGDTQKAMSISTTIANTVLDQSVSVMTSDAQADERFAAGASILAQGIQAVMAVPLRNQDKVTGLIYADSRLGTALYGDDDLRLLTMLANIAAIQLENSALFAEQLEKQRFEREAQAAADIQKRLLPRTRPEIEGYGFEGRNDPCHECGGDYYDCLQLGGDNVGIVLADVAGKGMGAAMLMAVIQATLQARAVTGATSKELVDQLGHAIAKSAPTNRYATLFYIDLDLSTHKLQYVNAGHAPSPFCVRSSGEVLELPAGGTPLGLFPGFDYPVTDLELGPGDFIFACSDGVTDLEDPDEEMYGEERLKELLVSLAGRSTDEIRTKVDAELEAFAKNTRQPDDLTYIILQRGC